LNEVLALLTTLSEAWHTIKPEPRTAAPPSQADSRYSEEPPADAGYQDAPQYWSA